MELIQEELEEQVVEELEEIQGLILVLQELQTQAAVEVVDQLSTVQKAEQVVQE